MTSPDAAAAGKALPSRPSGLRLALFLLVAAAFVVGGVLFYYADRRQLRSAAETELAAIAELKVNQISSWRSERLADASVLSNNRPLAAAVAEFLESPGRPVAGDLLATLRSFQRFYGYRDVLLTDAAGHVRWSLSGRLAPLHDSALAALAAAVRDRGSTLSELHASPGTLPAHVDVVSPIFADDPATSVAIGAVVLQVSAHDFLDPLIMEWPTPSRSAETLLVRRDGDSVLFLNELRHRQGTSLSLRIPLSSREVPAVMAAEGKRGSVEGRDYRGIPVLASLVAVPDTPWIIVAKIDADEALAPARSRALLVGVLVSALVLATLVAFFALWQREGRSRFQRLYEAEKGRVESEARYRSLFEHMVEGVAHCRMVFEHGRPSDFEYLDTNPAFARITGLANAVGKRVSELIPGIRESNPELLTTYGRVAATGAHATFETYVPPLGIWFQVSVYSPASGEFVAVFADVTARKKAEEALRASEADLHAMFDLASVGIAQADPQTGRWVRVNQKMSAITGYTADELLRLQIPEITHPDDRAADREAFERVVRGEAPAYRMEKRYLRKDGTETWVNVNMTVIRDAAGRPVRTMAAVEDISERQRAEQALRESEAFTRVVLDNLPLGIAVNSVDPAVVFSYMNENFLRIYRTTRDALTGADAFWDAVYEDPDFRESLRRRVLADSASGDVQRMHWEDVPIARRGEETTFVSARNIPVPGKPLMISTVWDVTERKRSELALSASEARYRRLFESARDGILILDADTGMILDVNPYLTVMLGFSRDHFLRKAVWDLGFFKDVVANRDKFLELQQRNFVRYENLPLETASGRRIDVEFVSNVYLVNERRVIQCDIRDITARRRAEAALHNAHERLRRFVDSNIIGVLIVNAAGGVLEANDYYLRLIGFSRDELARGEVDWRAITPPEWLPVDERAIRELRERGTCTPYEKEYLRRDGTRVPVLLADAVLPGPAEEIAAFALDLAELKRAEQEVRQLNEELEQRVRERTGQLEAANKELEAFAYSVSHDLRAPLRGIDGWSLALVEDYGERLEGEARQYLHRIRAEAQRMGQLIDDMLQLARVARTPLSPRPVNLSELAETIIGRLRASHPERLVETAIERDVMGYGDATLLEAVLGNLIENAWKFSQPRRPAHIAFGATRLDGERVFSVRDDGVGFDMAYAQKLFGLFQRLHKTSEFPGTGVGLATVQRIVHRHGGRVWAEAEVGRGATFSFTLEEGA